MPDETKVANPDALNPDTPPVAQTPPVEKSDDQDKPIDFATLDQMTKKEIVAFGETKGFSLDGSLNKPNLIQSFLDALNPDNQNKGATVVKATPRALKKMKNKENTK